jgi:hypothetical protein
MRPCAAARGPYQKRAHNFVCLFTYVSMHLKKKQQRPAQHARRQPAADPRSRVRVFATESESTADSLRFESSHSCIDVSYSRPGPILADRRSPLEHPASAPNSDRPSRPCLQPAASEYDRRSGPGRCCSL